MNILLKSLDLVHFKCFNVLHLDFHEGVNNIYGENAAGKTSVYDSLTWLLFNKDSAGNARPDIKPHHAPAGTMPEVTAVLEVDGEPIKLRKVLREKWEKPRGSSIERYAGDTRDYYIDDVPLAENEYKRRIAELIDERQFKLLTDVWAVTKGMHWKDRRTLLAEICGLPEDKQLLAAAPQFAELNEKVGRRTVDEYKSVLMKQRKDMNANLNTLPVRVDECSRMMTELESLDFAAAHSESDRLQAERERVQGELMKLTNNTLAAQVRNELGALQNQLRELETENAAHLASQRVPVEDETSALTAALDRAKLEADRLTRTIAQERDLVLNGETRLDDYRARWRAIDAEVFTDEHCPTCGQVFPAERLAAAQQSFEDGKNRRKNAKNTVSRSGDGVFIICSRAALRLRHRRGDLRARDTLGERQALEDGRKIVGHAAVEIRIFVGKLHIGRQLGNEVVVRPVDRQAADGLILRQLGIVIIGGKDL